MGVEGNIHTITDVFFYSNTGSNVALGATACPSAQRSSAQHIYDSNSIAHVRRPRLALALSNPSELACPCLSYAGDQKIARFGKRGEGYVRKDNRDETTRDECAN